MGGVRPDSPLCFDDNVVFVTSDLTNRPLAWTVRIVLVLNVVVVDHGIVVGKIHSCLQKLISAVGEVHHDPVGPVGVLTRHLADITLDSRDSSGDIVAAGILSEILDRVGVDVDADGGGPTLGERDDERADAGEHVEGAFSLTDLFDDAVALGRQPRREIDCRQVQRELTTVLSMDGLSPVASENPPLANALLPFDFRGAIDDRLDGQVGSHDRLGNLACPFGVVLVNDDDFPETLVARIELEQISRHRLSFTGRNLPVDDLVFGRDSVRGDDRDEQRPGFDGDFVAGIDEIGVGETLTGSLAILARDTNARDGHGHEWGLTRGKPDVSTLEEVGSRVGIGRHRKTRTLERRKTGIECSSNTSFPTDYYYLAEYIRQGMSDQPEEWTGLFEGSSKTPIKERSPELRADILILAASRIRRESVTAALPSGISVKSFSNIDPFSDALSGNIAVVLLSKGLPNDQLLGAASRTIQATNYTRIGLLIGDEESSKDVRVPHDEIFHKSGDRKTFQNRVKRLYIRAYYDATLQRYYTVNLAAQNRKLGSDEETATDSDRLQKLTKSVELLESHLERFRQYLQPGDLEAILTRSERIESMLDVKKDRDPTVRGLPRGCPNCGLAWDEWHGPRLKGGYKKTGADTWRCTRCSNVIAGDDPDNYKVS